MGPTLSSLRSRWFHPQLQKPVSGGAERQLEPKLQDLKSFIQPLITSFANEIGYSPLKTTSNDALWKAMRTYADNTGVPYEQGSHSWLMFKVGYVYPVYWDPLIANFIVTASLNFLNSNALEARSEFHQIERTKAGRSWAWFLREKDSVGEAYAWFTFPRHFVLTFHFS
ncbi:longiborneol synthase [Fusarium sp. NRRL 52700]|nr:longiborneol synthase [Fusarium sp. NRRL 52700]